MRLLFNRSLTAPPIESFIDLTSELQSESDKLTDNSVPIEETGSEEEEFNDIYDEEEENKFTIFKPALPQAHKFWKPLVAIEKATTIREIYQGQTISTDASKSEEGKIYNKDDFKKLQLNGGHPPMMSQKDRDAIGDYGEKLVYQAFKKKLSIEFSHCRLLEVQKYSIFQVLIKDVVIAEIKLLNDKNRVQGGYDMIIIKNGETFYYEIKTTVRNDNPLFRISEEQWRFIKMKGNAYSVIRVLNAGEQQPNLIEINDPYRLWKEEKLIGYPVNIQL